MPDPDEPATFLVRHRRVYERMLLALLWIAVGLVAAGVVGVATGLPTWQTAGAAATVVGLVFASVAVGMGYPIATLRTIAPTTRGGTKYERRRRWTQLKSTSILLNMLTIISVGALVLALLSRSELFRVGLGPETAVRFTWVLVAAMALNVGFAHYMALRTPIERVTNPIQRTVVFLLVALSALIGLFGFFALNRLEVANALDLGQSDTAYIILAAHVFLSVGLFQARALPTIYALFAEEREYYRGLSYLSRGKSVLLPTMVAFALLFLVLLVGFVFNIGVVGLVEEIPRNFVLLTIFAFIVLALVASVWASFSLSRTEDKVSLYKRKRTAEAKREIWILSVSLGVTFIFLVIAALLVLNVGRGALGWIPRTRWIDFVCYALLASMGPYGFYWARKQSRIRRLEERFPDFLRDLAASRKAGLTLEASIKVAAKGEYGALTPEIQKMADQLSWNVPFEETLRRFGNRVRTPLVERAVSLIIEAGRTGGQITDVFAAAASDAREIKNLEQERRSNMALYSIIVYITFFVFLLVAAVLYGTFIPEFVAAGEAAQRAGAGSFAGVNLATLGLSSYRVFYFTAALVQSVGNGFIAGIMESGRALGGLRHGFILVAITYVTFTFMLP